MKRTGLLMAFLLAAALPSGARTYSTDFPLTESPISEGGNWVNGSPGYVYTASGRAYGHSGPNRYQDATAILTGTWGPDQTAQATVYAGAVSNAPEVELHLRATLTSGYEISHSVVNGQNGSYLIVVEYASGGFSILQQLNGSSYSVKTGDVVTATISGNVITVYKNGGQETQVTDNTFSSGTPGIGFNELTNGDYGISSFTASDGAATVVADSYRSSDGAPHRRPCLIGVRGAGTEGSLQLVIRAPGGAGAVSRTFDLSGHEIKRLEP